MIQYKEKSARAEAAGQGVRLSLLTYPVLMAADILAYEATRCRSGTTRRSTWS